LCFSDAASPLPTGFADGRNDDRLSLNFSAPARIHKVGRTLSQAINPGDPAPTHYYSVVCSLILFAGYLGQFAMLEKQVDSYRFRFQNSNAVLDHSCRLQVPCIQELDI
jgi:hypothetical protein